MPDPHENQPSRRPEDGKDAYRQWYQIAGVGFEFGAAVLLLGLLGWYLDRRWETAPWLMLIGGGLGFMVGLWLLIKTARRSFHD